ncbi:FprA family A-type flavoprotein [Alkalibacter rhizosphaerae]|uniref:FprA family A-type flavoprotein n=1 Tax=Alkalibacter rhizosphaerae TaxID=2815577 RepID=A0A975AI82_9FIRM|nr:FprA family A-type flavoprotein [Alkalibacter rhizosphaerae]QSX08409.1 FprA family A-type flavoprotein [Alkalibacter rhizosphaerae]
MKNVKIADGVHMLSMNVEDILFEGMWDLANGVTLNSYVVQGEKTAIVDGVIGWDGIPETLYDALEKMGVKIEDLDYAIVNHMEPDHSGWMESLLKIKGDIRIYASQKSAALLDQFFDKTENVVMVKDGDTLDLGAGKVLSFHLAPNVHWPDTMMTLDNQTGTLMSCDMYGSFGKIENSYFDDEMSDQDKAFFEEEGIRYYSNVMATFGSFVQKAIDKTKGLDVKIIAPGHGPVYRSNPSEIMDNYQRYIGYGEGKGKREIAILWGSMYGMTKKALDHVLKILEKEAISVHLMEMPRCTESDMVAAIFKSAGVIVAAPTYEYKLFPPVAAAIDEAGRKKITNKAAVYFGSCGWSGGAWKELSQIIERNNMKWDFDEPLEFKGSPHEEDLKKVEAQVMELVKKVRAIANEA